MYKRLKDVAEIRLCLAQRATTNKMYKALTPIKLLENNVVDGFILDNKVRADDATKVCTGDIIIKRICPWFANYIDEIEDDGQLDGFYAVGRFERKAPGALHQFFRWIGFQAP